MKLEIYMKHYLAHYISAVLKKRRETKLQFLYDIDWAKALLSGMSSRGYSDIGQTYDVESTVVSEESQSSDLEELNQPLAPQQLESSQVALSRSSSQESLDLRQQFDDDNCSPVVSEESRLSVSEELNQSCAQSEPSHVALPALPSELSSLGHPDHGEPSDIKYSPVLSEESQPSELKELNQPCAPPQSESSHVALSQSSSHEGRGRVQPSDIMYSPLVSEQSQPSDSKEPNQPFEPPQSEASHVAVSRLSSGEEPDLGQPPDFQLHPVVSEQSQQSDIEELKQSGAPLQSENSHVAHSRLSSGEDLDLGLPSDVELNPVISEQSQPSDIEELNQPCVPPQSECSHIVLSGLSLKGGPGFGRPSSLATSKRKANIEKSKFMKKQIDHNRGSFLSVLEDDNASDDMDNASDDMDVDYEPESESSGSESESECENSQVFTGGPHGKKTKMNLFYDRIDKKGMKSQLIDSDVEEYVSDSEVLSDNCSSPVKMKELNFPSGVSPKKKCHDKSNKHIYVRKVLKSGYSVHGQKKKRMTVWNQVHCCKFCHKIGTNIAKHYRTHSKENDVIEVLQMSRKLGAKNKLVAAKWDMLRNEGDHLINKKTLKRGEGEMILGRRKAKSTFKADEYGPCPGCHVWIKLDRTMRLHQKVCPAVILGIAEYSKSGKEIRILSLCEAGRINEEASQGLKEEVFVIMKNDTISITAQNDSLIVSLGNMWLLKNIGNKLKRKYYTSQRMRDAARLLLNLKQQTHTDKDLYHYLTPEFFNDVVKAALTTASPEFDDEEDLKSPSTAIKLGYDIKRMVGAKWAMCLKMGAREEVDKCNDFLKLMQLEWSLKVSKVAHITLQTRRFNAVRSLPLPSDLVKLQDHVKTELTSQRLDPSTVYLETYRRAVELCETRLLLYNKRRSGEIEAITVKQYTKRQCGVSDIDRSMRAHLSKLEEHLLENQELIETRGKGGRGVPVIVPMDTKRALMFISNASVRHESGILPDNVYLFPNTKLGAVRAYDSLKKICKELNLKQPEQITSVNMRKYTATISQIFDMSMQEQQWLMNHLGHSLDIHKIHYRQTSGVIERVDIAKLMLLQEFDIAGKYAGKKLGDIDMQELVLGSETNKCTDIIQVQSEDGQETAQLIGVTDDEVQPDIRTVDTYDEYQFQDDDSPDEPTKSKSKSKNTRVAWTREEMEEIQEYFQLNINSGVTPGRQECSKAIEQSRMKKGSIHRRHWETIKKKVWNLIQKTKL